MPYLPYEEPGITTILSLTAFLLLLNGSRYILDRLLYCGLIGEILVGIIWGLPVGETAWLSEGTQETIQALGYLGLIGLVFEGGLSTDMALLRKNAYASVSVATVGLSMPIAFSFLLLLFPFSSSAGQTAYPTPLAAFSAGASLCSTSLGTTFTILSSACLQKTRVGVVLVGAAMMDDVVGLVMVNIVTTLGKGGTSGWLIARPIATSFGLLLVTLALCPYVLRPVWKCLLDMLYREVQPDFQVNSKSTLRNKTAKLIRNIPHLSFILSTLVLIVFVEIASFIDASVLFAAFIAGGIVSFLWAFQNEQQQQPGMTSKNGPVEMYAEYYTPAMDYILVPFFFASIGFSIPITDMFTRSIIWKGIIYSVLMVIAKSLTASVLYFEYFLKVWKEKKPILHRRTKKTSSQPGSEQTRPISTVNLGELSNHDQELSNHDQELSTGPPHSTALLVGLAMVARGEIGFLIASLSQSSGTLTLKHRNKTQTESSDQTILLVIVWAVVICTIVGPLGVGIVVRWMRA